MFLDIQLNGQLSYTKIKIVRVWSILNTHEKFYNQRLVHNFLTVTATKLKLTYCTDTNMAFLKNIWHRYDYFQV